MKKKICAILLAALAALLPARAMCEDKSVGKQYKSNPSTTMKPYYIKNIKPVNADSTEVKVEKEVKLNVPLLHAADTWEEVGFTIRPAVDPAFLNPTAMAPSADPRIKAIADRLKGATPEETAKNIFKFANDGTDFQFYMNSQKGAIGALDSKKANCCDQSHLVVAILRAAGIPARYSHCNPCKFTTSGMVVGHVWPEARLGGKWVTMDTSSSKNSVGVVKNFTKLANPKYYAELPF